MKKITTKLRYARKVKGELLQSECHNHKRGKQAPTTEEDKIYKIKKSRGILRCKNETGADFGELPSNITGLI